MRLKERVAIVTGGAQGAGRAYALGLAREGAQVTVADVADGSDTVQAIAALGGEALALLTDVREESSTAEMARKTHERFGRIDVLVNNAALYRDIVLQPFEEITLAEWDHMMAVNLRGLFLCAKAVVPYMKQQRSGKIINISSSAVLFGLPGMLHYVTSKAGVIGFTRALARELGRSGIAVNTVSPGMVLNEGSRQIEANKKLPFHSLADAARQGRAISKDLLEEDLVGTMVFLSSGESDMITGQLFNVDGGGIMY
ncbi:MAG: SDR family oxidoreductase [Acidobacteria bacterium]|nr:SDR family oxidoreductase [Acidobacteriota bacterium]